MLVQSLRIKTFAFNTLQLELLLTSRKLLTQKGSSIYKAIQFESL